MPLRIGTPNNLAVNALKFDRTDSTIEHSDGITNSVDSDQTRTALFALNCLSKIIWKKEEATKTFIYKYQFIK